MSGLANARCVPCEGGVPPLDKAALDRLFKQLGSRWKLSDDGKSLSGHFRFKNYYRCTAFVTAVSWIAHREDHHPQISFGYDAADILWTTHAIGGLSENDFICAAKVDALLD